MTTIYAPQGAEENGVTLTVSPLPHYSTCWDGHYQFHTLPLVYHAVLRCPECGSVLVNRMCPRCDR